MIDIKTLGRQLKNARTARNLTIAELASRIGKSSRSIDKYESGETHIPINVLNELCDALNCTVDIIIKPNLYTKK